MLVFSTQISPSTNFKKRTCPSRKLGNEARLYVVVKAAKGQAYLSYSLMNEVPVLHFVHIALSALSLFLYSVSPLCLPFLLGESLILSLDFLLLSTYTFLFTSPFLSTFLLPCLHPFHFYSLNFIHTHESTHCIIRFSRKADTSKFLIVLGMSGSFCCARDHDQNKYDLICTYYTHGTPFARPSHQPQHLIYAPTSCQTHGIIASSKNWKKMSL